MPDSLRHGVEYALAYSTLRAFGALPHGLALRLGEALGAFSCSPLRIRLSVVEAQIAEALAKLDRAVAATGDLSPLSDTLTMLAATYLLVGQDDPSERLAGIVMSILVAILGVNQLVF